MEFSDPLYHLVIIIKFLTEFFMLIKNINNYNNLGINLVFDYFEEKIFIKPNKHFNEPFLGN